MWIRQEAAAEAGRKAAIKSKNKVEFEVVYKVHGGEQGYVVKLYSAETGTYLGLLH